MGKHFSYFKKKKNNINFIIFGSFIKCRWTLWKHSCWRCSRSSSSFANKKVHCVCMCVVVQNEQYPACIITLTYKMIHHHLQFCYCRHPLITISIRPLCFSFSFFILLLLFFPYNFIYSCCCRHNWIYSLLNTNNTSVAIIVRVGHHFMTHTKPNQTKLCSIFFFSLLLLLFIFGHITEMTWLFISLLRSNTLKKQAQENISIYH